jgi:methanogenic corrinoid protein MtbC1/DNA-binding transcriptional MerR regulator
MRVVTRRTGLSPEILRVWERRYRVVTPARTQTGRRLYSDSEIERLHLLHRATLGGRNIGLIASLSTPALLELLRQDAEADRARATSVDAGRVAPGVSPASRFVGESLDAVEQFDPVSLGAVLRRASVVLPAVDFLEHVVTPLLEQVGARWRDGTLRAVHGHLAAAVVRRALERIIVAAPPPAPKILMATVTGQVHELGAMIAAAAAAAEGWSVTWLGSNLPVEDIAEAADKLHVAAVGLSLVHPAAEAAVSGELRRLRSLLPRSVELIVGGSAIAGYTGVLDEIGAVPTKDLNALIARLRDIAGRTRSTDVKSRKRMQGAKAGRSRRQT